MPTTKTEAAEVVKVSRRTMQDAVTIQSEGGKKLAEKVASGEVPIATAAKAVRTVLCPRCQRMGVPVKECKQCAEMRLTVAEKPATKPVKTARAALSDEPSPNGKPEIDPHAGKVKCPHCHGSGWITEKLGKFIQPTVEQVQEYSKEVNAGIDAEKFVDYYSANGWKVGKSKMVDWKAAVRNWKRNAKGFGNGRISRVEAPAGKYTNVGIKVGQAGAPK